MKKLISLAVLTALLTTQSIMPMAPNQSKISQWLNWGKSQISTIWDWAKENPKISVPLGVGATALAGLYFYKKANQRDIFQIGEEEVAVPRGAVSFINQCDSTPYNNWYEYTEDLNPRTTEIIIKNSRKGNLVFVASKTIKTPCVKMIYYTNDIEEIQFAEFQLDQTGKCTIPYEGKPNTRTDYFVYVPLNMKNIIIK